MEPDGQAHGSFLLNSNAMGELNDPYLTFCIVAFPCVCIVVLCPKYYNNYFLHDHFLTPLHPCELHRHLYYNCTIVFLYRLYGLVNVTF